MLQGEALIHNWVSSILSRGIGQLIVLSVALGSCLGGSVPIDAILDDLGKFFTSVHAAADTRLVKHIFVE